MDVNMNRYPIAALLLVLVGACGKSEPEQAAPSAAPPAVTIAHPLQKTTTEWDEFLGRFEAVETVEVRARVSGYLDSVNFADGQIVEKDDLLFVIDPRPFEFAVAQAEAEIRQTEAQLELAISDVKRTRPLAKKGNVAEQELDERQARQRELEGVLSAAKSRLRNALLELKWTEVRAAVTGRISNNRVDVGNLVTGGQAGATLLTTIVSIDPIHFVFEASESDYLKYTRLASDQKRPSSRETGNPVLVRLIDEPEFTHRGEMNFVDNAIDGDTGTIRGRAILGNESNLLVPGLFGRLRLFGGKFDALLVPDPAILSDQARKIVLVVDNDQTVRAKVVTLGPMIDGLRVVRTGLSAEDRVIIDGIQRARTGQPVTPQDGEIQTASASEP